MSPLKVGYARVSTDEQDLTAQRDGLAAFGVNPKRIYVDHGLTGRNADREGLRQALAACRDGDTFVVTKLDRLARSVRDAHQIADDLAAREVKLSIAGSVYDPTDPMGKLLFNVLAMVAEFEADLIRARTREGMKVAKAKGRLRGKSPKLTPGKKLTSSSYMLPTSTPWASWPSCSAWAAPRSTAPFSAPSAGARTPCSRCVVDARARWRILRLHFSQDQRRYFTNMPQGHGLMKSGNAVIPIDGRIPSDSKLYALFSTTFGEGN